jgi:hypothetical protein
MLFWEMQRLVWVVGSGGMVYGDWAFGGMWNGWKRKWKMDEKGERVGWNWKVEVGKEEAMHPGRGLCRALV